MPSLDRHAADPGLIAAIARHFVAVGDFGAAEEALSAAPLSTSAAIGAALVELGDFFSAGAPRSANDDPA